VAEFTGDDIASRFPLLENEDAVTRVRPYRHRRRRILERNKRDYNGDLAILAQPLPFNSLDQGLRRGIPVITPMHFETGEYLHVSTNR